MASTPASRRSRIAARLAARPRVVVALWAASVMSCLSAPLGATWLALGWLAAACSSAAVLVVTAHWWLARERAQALQDAFGRYVPSAVLDSVVESSMGVSTSSLEPREVELSVLFCDVRGFTSWAQRRDPRTVLNEVNDLLGVLAEAIMARGGTLARFTGDGLMAFWNAPEDREDHASRAVAAAQAILHAVQSRNSDRARIGMPSFEVGVGVHTGPAMVGHLGSADRVDYTAVGDTVNLAARIESATKDAVVPLLISEATFLQLPFDEQRRCKVLEQMRVRGRGDTRVRVYTVPAVQLVRELRDVA